MKMTIISVLVLIALLIFPSECISSARDALYIWGMDVVPSLFPYIFFCRILAYRLVQRNLPVFPVIFTLGMAGGSPCGASVIASCRERTSPGALLPFAALTGTLSPMFLLSTVNSWIQNQRICIFLLISQYTGAGISCLCAYFWSKYSGPGNMLPEADHSENTSSNAISESIRSVLSIGGCIIIFSVLGTMIGMVPYISGYKAALIHCLLEVSGGMHALAAYNYADGIQAVLFAFFAGFSGLSIVFQNYTVLGALGIRMSELICTAIIRAVGSAACMVVLLFYFRIS